MAAVITGLFKCKWEKLKEKFNFQTSLSLADLLFQGQQSYVGALLARVSKGEREERNIVDDWEERGSSCYWDCCGGSSLPRGCRGWVRMERRWVLAAGKAAISCPYCVWAFLLQRDSCSVLSVDRPVRRRCSHASACSAVFPVLFHRMQRLGRFPPEQRKRKRCQTKCYSGAKQRRHTGLLLNIERTLWTGGAKGSDHSRGSAENNNESAWPFQHQIKSRRAARSVRASR